MASKDGVTNGIITAEPMAFPGFGPKPVDESDFKNYSVKYAQIDIMDPGSRAELEIIETKAVKGQGIIILTKDKFTFMDKYYMVVSYLQLETRDADTSR
jgi:hypothetical protein